VAACPTQIVVHGDGGFPEVDFRRGECTFCGACTEQCQTGALRKNKQEGMQPWAYRALIGPACLAEQGVVCRSCGDVCADRAIRFQPRSGGVALPAIRMDACSGCGTCVGTCPTQAIAMVNHQEGAMQ
jgi:ferredoxin-type protein NapF